MALAFHRMLVEEVLRPLRNQDVVYVPNPGNGGDSLIATGTFDCFRRLGIRYDPPPETGRAEGRTVILAGGGNLVPLYRAIRWALLRYRNSAKQIILLPHTIRGHEDVLEKLGSNVTIICRDMASYRHVAAHCHKPTVLLGHDMAWHLDYEAFQFDEANIALHRPLFLERLAARKISLETWEKRPRVFFKRTDIENGGPIGGTGVDLSALFGTGTAPGKAERGAWCILEAIRHVRHVVTDRLHVSIAASLVGRPCDVFDNSYGKNAEIYLHSMKYHFRNIQLRQREPEMVQAGEAAAPAPDEAAAATATATATATAQG